jgi:hypothetical protein
VRRAVKPRGNFTMLDAAAEGFVVAKRRYNGWGGWARWLVDYLQKFGVSSLAAVTRRIVLAAIETASDRDTARQFIFEFFEHFEHSGAIPLNPCVQFLRRREAVSALTVRERTSRHPMAQAAEPFAGRRYSPVRRQRAQTAIYEFLIPLLKTLPRASVSQLQWASMTPATVIDVLNAQLDQGVKSEIPFRELKVLREMFDSFLGLAPAEASMYPGIGPLATNPCAMIVRDDNDRYSITRPTLRPRKGRHLPSALGNSARFDQSPAVLYLIAFKDVLKIGIGINARITEVTASAPYEGEPQVWKFPVPIAKAQQAENSAHSELERYALRGEFFSRPHAEELEGLLAKLPGLIAAANPGRAVDRVTKRHEDGYWDHVPQPPAGASHIIGFATSRDRCKMVYGSCVDRTAVKKPFVELQVSVAEPIRACDRLYAFCSLGEMQAARAEMQTEIERLAPDAIRGWFPLSLLSRVCRQAPPAGTRHLKERDLVPNPTWRNGEGPPPGATDGTKSASLDYTQGRGLQAGSSEVVDKSRHCVQFAAN